ncbi:MAG: SDR family oxidoreductase [Candidatus Binataceae bacterium]
MDLGIAGRKAIVCASSRGLGRACAEALAAEGVQVVINGRDGERLDKALRELKQSGATATAVKGDITTEDVRAALLKACAEPDILINNNAGPSPTNFVEIDHATWLAGLEANMIAPLMLVRAVLPGMRKRRFGRIINITSAMVKTPRPPMGLSSGARAGLTAVMKGQSVECARDNVTINNLLPYIIDTDRQRWLAQRRVETEGITFEQARAQQIAGVAAKRMGEAREFGAICAFLCSALAGYISGQNIHVDGGSYPALI